MATRPHDEKQHAHELIDRMAPGQVSAVVPLLEIILDPLAHALASAPYDDEPIGQEEAREVATSKAALARGEAIPHQEVLAELGLTSEDFERMGRAPLKPDGSKQLSRSHPGEARDNAQYFAVKKKAGSSSPSLRPDSA